MTEGLFRASLLKAADRFFALGEDGIFVELKLSAKAPEVIHKTRLFTATEAWTLSGRCPPARTTASPLAFDCWA